MTIKRKNYYEELIDKMMLEGINGLSDALKEKIENLPTKQKRLNILRVLEENDIQHRKLFSSILSIVKDNDIRATEHIKDVVTKLRAYVEVGAVEKKKFGEVMTPITLVEEMLDTLPNEVWSNPDLKWLDNCGGVGIFPSVIIDRLMEGLSNIFPDDDDRYEYIMENMIYFAELQPKNMFLYLCASDPEDKYNLNIYNGSFLGERDTMLETFDTHADAVWGVTKFDIIVMNPPYQEIQNGKRTFQSATLWDRFVEKSLETTLKEDGYLVAVHPDGWRSLSNRFKKVKNLLKSKEMIYLELHNTSDGIKTFGASTAYDFYCVRNKENSDFLTKIKFMDGMSKMLNINSMNFIPNGMLKEFKKLIANGDEIKVDMSLKHYAYDHKKNHTSKEQTKEFKYPCVYLTYKDDSINFWYSNTNKFGHFGIPKVIWSNGSGTQPIIDVNGEYGMCEYCFAIIDKPENLPKIQQAMKNPKFTKLMSFSDGVTGVGMHKYNHKVISMFRKDFWKEFI